MCRIVWLLHRWIISTTKPKNPSTCSSVHPCMSKKWFLSLKPMLFQGCQGLRRTSCPSADVFILHFCFSLGRYFLDEHPLISYVGVVGRTQGTSKESWMADSSATSFACYDVFLQNAVEFDEHILHHSLSWIQIQTKVSKSCFLWHVCCNLF